jgi:RimJ/RimL family protein N-acetyltransferase
MHMHIETERLLLKPLNAADAEAYFHLSQNEGFRRFQISNYQKSSIEESLRWIETLEQDHARNGLGIVGAFSKVNDELIGLGALKPLDPADPSLIELMYRIHDTHWARGFGSEIAAGLLRWAHAEAKLHLVVATVDPANEASKKILSKLGFRFKKMIQIEGQREELHELQF